MEMNVEDDGDSYRSPLHISPGETMSWHQVLQPSEGGFVNYAAIHRALDLSDARLHFGARQKLSLDGKLDESPIIKRFDFLSSGREAWRRHRQRQRQLRLKYPRATLIGTIIAWALSIVACAIAITFLTLEFVSSRTSNVVSISYENVQNLTLPVISLCSPLVNVPPFPTFHSGDERTRGSYPGLPLWTVKAVYDYENATGMKSEHTSWPGAISWLTPAYRGPPGNICSERLSRMNITSAKHSFDMLDSYINSTASSNSSASDPFCQYCVQIGREPKVHMRGDAKQTREAPLRGRSSGVEVQIVLAKTWAACKRYPVELRIPPDVHAFLASEVRKHWIQLEERGIIDGSGIDHTDDVIYERYVPTRPPPLKNLNRMNQPPNDINRHWRSWEMLCGVYFYGGYFYPAIETGISYQLNRSTFFWERSGRGPYFTKYPINSLNISEFGIELSPHRVLNLPDMNTSPVPLPIQVFVEDSPEPEPRLQVSKTSSGVRFLTRVGDKARLVAVIDPETKAELSLSRTQSRGLPIHEVSTSTTFAGLFSHGSVYMNWFVHIKFSTFIVENITGRDAIPVIRFMADFLGYVSMALGISLYTVVVAPTNMLFFGIVRDDLNAQHFGAGKFGVKSNLQEVVDRRDNKPRTRAGRFRISFGLRRRPP